MPKVKDKPKSKKKKRTLAAKADKYDLYQQSVQVPDCETKFFTRAYKDAFADKPMVLREDFCGTFAVCCDWARSDKDRLAYGVDLDPEPLAWGRKHNLSQIKRGAQERVTTVLDDVRKVQGPKADVLAAQNFSYFIFKERDALRDYFEFAHANIADRGIMVLDIMGGSECLLEDQEDIRIQDGFKYIWEEERFDPITHDALFHIHFKFPDKSTLSKAFTYDWRLWTIPEVRELLAEAGFAATHVYWEGTDKKTGEGNSVFRRKDHAPADPAWVAYIVAVKGEERQP